MWSRPSHLPDLQRYRAMAGRTYSIHGLTAVRVDGEGALAELAHRAMAGFPRVDEPGDVVWSPGDDLQTLLQDQLLTQGALLVHACGFAYRDRGVLLFGAPNSGKSAFVLTSLDDPDLRLLGGDDRALITGAGELLSFPFPIVIRDHHRRLLPEQTRRRLEADLRGHRALAALHRVPIARAAGRSVRRRLITRGAAAAEIASRLNPRYVTVMAEDVLPPARLAEHASADVVVELARTGSAWDVVDLSVEEARSRLLARAYDTLELSEPLLRYALAGSIDLARHWRLAGDVSAAFLERVRRRVRLVVPQETPPAELRARVLELVLA